MIDRRTTTAGLAATALILLGGCDQSQPNQTSEMMFGNVNAPDLSMAVWEATGRPEASEEPSIRATHERCEKRPPIVAPEIQVWSCRFSFEFKETTRNCSVLMSVHPDLHGGVWRPDYQIDPKTGEMTSTLVCSEAMSAKE